MLVKYVSIDGIPQAFLPSWFFDIIVITVHDHFWNLCYKSNVAYLTEEQHIQILNPWSTTHKASMLTFTQPMRFDINEYIDYYIYIKIVLPMTVAI